LSRALDCGHVRKYGRLPAAKVIDLIKKQKADGKIVVLATHAGLFARTLCGEAVLLRADKEAICGTQAFTKAELN
jgi:ABC-type multidrug transport system ATPase subunit